MVLGCFGFWGCVVLFIGDEEKVKKTTVGKRIKFD